MENRDFTIELQMISDKGENWQAEAPLCQRHLMLVGGWLCPVCRTFFGDINGDFPLIDVMCKEEVLKNQLYNVGVVNSSKGLLMWEAVKFTYFVIVLKFIFQVLYFGSCFSDHFYFHFAQDKNFCSSYIIERSLLILNLKVFLRYTLCKNVIFLFIDFSKEV